MTQNKLAVIAFGGNALLKSKQKGTYAEQIENVTETCKCLVPMIKAGYRMVIGHGNGPQVGNVMLQHKAGKEAFSVEAMPLNFCVAETQGSIGALIEEGMRHICTKEKLDRDTVTLLTHVEVDANDPLFQNPTKPVGPYVTKEEADANHADDDGGVQRVGDDFRVVAADDFDGLTGVVLSGGNARCGNVGLHFDLLFQGDDVSLFDVRIKQDLYFNIFRKILEILSGEEGEETKDADEEHRERDTQDGAECGESQTGFRNPIYGVWIFCHCVQF